MPSRKAPTTPTKKGGNMPKTTVSDRTQAQFRLPDALLQRLENEANRRVVSKTLLVERALENALTAWEKDLVGASN
jgi:predicted DNA-binding protein